MRREYVIEACKAMAVSLKKGQMITVADIEGGQVADFFARSANDKREFLSTGVTIDCNCSLELKVGDIVYSNLYNPMFKVVKDDVGKHDLLHPCCRPEMYDFFYNNGQGHPNCFNNINSSLNEDLPIIHPLNIFMNTKIYPDGRISVERPISSKGDSIVLEALMDVDAAISACSVSESECNAQKCTGIKIIVDDG